MTTVVGSAAIRFMPDFTGFKQQLDAELRAITSGLQNVKVVVEADTAAAKVELTEIERLIGRIDGRTARVRVEADTSAARANLDAVERSVSRLGSQRANIHVEVDTLGAQLHLDALSRVVHSLNHERIEIHVEIHGTVSALADLAAVASALDRINGRRAEADVGVNGGSGGGAAAGAAGALSFGSVMAGLSPVLFSVASGLAPIVGLLGVLPGAFLGAASAAGVLKVAFGGIGNAIKTSDAATAAALAMKGPGAQASAAAAVASANDALASANRGLDQAQTSIARQAVDDARAISDAQRGVTDAIRTAARTQAVDLAAMALDNRALGDALKAVQVAQNDLTQARKDALTTIRDLNNSEKDAALQLREANIALVLATRTRNAVDASSAFTTEQRARAQLTYEEAVQRQVEAQQKATDAAQKAQVATQKGVDQAPAVIAAQNKVTLAQRTAGDAAAKVAAAQRKIADDAVIGQEAVAKANEAVGTAQQKAARDQADAGDKIVAANQAVAAAQRQLAAATTTNSSAADAATIAYNKLTPAGKAFVDAFKELRKEFKPIGDAIKEAALPGFTSALHDLGGLLPLIKGPLVDVAGAFSEFAGGIGRLLSGPFKKDLPGLFATNTYVIRSLLGVDNGGGLTGLFKAITNIAVAAEPLIRYVSNLANSFGLWAANVTTGEAGRGRLQRFFVLTMDAVTTLGGILGNVFKAIVEIGKAAFPTGTGLLHSLDDLTAKFAAWAGTPEAQSRLRGFFEVTGDIFRYVASDVGQLVAKVVEGVAVVSKFLKEHPEALKLGTDVGVGLLATKLIPGASLGVGLLGKGLSKAAPAVIAGGPAAIIATGLAAGAVGLYASNSDFRKFVNDFVHSLAPAFDDAVHQIGSALGDLNHAISDFSHSGIGKFLSGIFSNELSTAFRVLGGFLSTVVDLFATLLELLTGHTDRAFEDASKAASSFGKALNLMSHGLIGEAFLAIVNSAKAMVDGIASAVSTVGRLLGHLPGGLGKSFRDAANDVDRMKREFDALAEGSISSIHKAIDPTTKSVNGLAAATKGAADGAPHMVDALGKVIDPAERAKTTVDDLKKAYDDLNQSIKDTISSFTVINKSAADQEALNTRVIVATSGLTKSVNDNGTSLDINTEKGRNNRAAFKDLITTTGDKIDADVHAKAATGDLSGAMVTAQTETATQRGALEKLAEQLGLSKKATQDMIDTQLKTPDQIFTSLETPGYAESMQNLKDFQAQISGLTGKDLQVAIDARYNAYRSPGQFPGKNLVSNWADGGIAGENHVAEIAPAGSWRVWAEPETGGEAYIPLAPEKRTRSRAIAQETVQRLGGVAHFASGGISNVGNGVDNFNNNISNLINGIQRLNTPFHKDQTVNAVISSTNTQVAFGNLSQYLNQVMDDISKHADRGSDSAGYGAVASAAVGGLGVSAIWAALRSAGVPEAQAAGIMGNMQFESGFNPFIIEGGGTSADPAAAGGGGYGLVQWTPGRKLIPYLGGQAPGINSEVNALMQQLNGLGPSPEGAAGAALRTAGNAGDAADIFGLRYERYAGPPQPGRHAAALRIFDHYQGMALGGTVDGIGNGDTVRAMLTPGEYVLRRDVARKIGTPTLDRINQMGSKMADSLLRPSAASSASTGHSGPFIDTVVIRENVDADLMIQRLEFLTRAGRIG